MKKFYIALAIVLVVALIGWFTPAQKIIETILGGSVHNTFETFDAGIGVDGYVRISGDGDIIQGGGVKNYGRKASMSLTAADLCDNTWIQINPYFNYTTFDDTGASVSFPTSATLIADCVPNPGDWKEVWIENTATSSARNIEVDDATDYELMKPGDTGVQTIITEDEIGLVRFFNLDGTSVSITFEMYLMD